MVSNFRSKEERHTIGRELSRLLRDEVKELDIEVDEYGYVQIDKILKTLMESSPWLTTAHILEIVDKDPQSRFQIEKNSIRARAGHRYSVSIPSDPIIPPDYLYHGTSEQNARDILETGLLRMKKAYVHLSSTTARARTVGLRISDTPVIVRVRALEASQTGIRFWRSGQVSDDGEIILSDDIPPRFIEKLLEN
jgi:putative RNA 2'-phosphotransferase